MKIHLILLCVLFAAVCECQNCNERYLDMEFYMRMAPAERMVALKEKRAEILELQADDDNYNCLYVSVSKIFAIDNAIVDITIPYKRVPILLNILDTAACRETESNFLLWDVCTNVMDRATTKLETLLGGSDYVRELLHERKVLNVHWANLVVDEEDRVYFDQYLQRRKEIDETLQNMIAKGFEKSPLVKGENL